jgi:hypothetical protein
METNQLDECMQATEKPIRNGMTDALKRVVAFTMNANQIEEIL